MLRDITLGQYYASESPIHKLDPRTKILATLLFIVQLFLVKGFLGFVLCGAVLAAVIKVSRVPLRFILRGLKPILMILAFTVILNIFMVNGTVIWQWHFLKITVEGLQRAAFLGIRLILLIICSSMLTFTTKPIELTDGLEKLMKPLSKLGLPTHEIAMMMSIALRFIPLLLEETDKIMKAQQARGADFESGNILNRAKAMIPLLVPLFISSLNIAQDLAMAMEARCYRGSTGRTRMNEIRFRKRDFIAMLLMVLTLAAVIAERVLIG
ncbi:MAG: energy-coupling factor transporter transmembrane protein EcfT [Clostridia bacterium]|nr:energy-coupling factor transporter transmembrane protein EcfT [Clostridia bacterium]